MAQNVGRGGGHSPANVTKHLKGINFPANKNELVKHAKKEGADKQVLDELHSFEDREYGSMADVMKEFGKEHQSSSKSGSKPTQKQTTH